MIDTVTLVLFLAIWPVWLVWELVLLGLRGGEVRVKTISMVARDLGWKCSGLVYLWGGLATHYWWPGAAWASVAGSVVFWVIAALLLVEDFVLWRWPVDTGTQAWLLFLRWQRLPVVVLVGGAIAGKLLFPQAAA